MWTFWIASIMVAVLETCFPTPCLLWYQQLSLSLHLGGGCQKWRMVIFYLSSYHTREKCWRPFPIPLYMFLNAVHFCWTIIFQVPESSTDAEARNAGFSLRYVSLIQVAQRQFEVQNLQKSLMPPARFSSVTLLIPTPFFLFRLTQAVPSPGMHMPLPNEISSNSLQFSTGRHRQLENLMLVTNNISEHRIYKFPLEKDSIVPIHPSI